MNKKPVETKTDERGPVAIPTEILESDVERYKRKKYFEACSVKKVPQFKLTKFIKGSDAFPIRFPVVKVKSKHILQYYSDFPEKKEEVFKELLQNALGAYPIIHENFLQLAIDFLEHKKKYGTSLEKPLYNHLSITTLITRLLKKRAVTFFGTSDRYTLLTGRKGKGNWTAVGTDQQMIPLLLKSCISYDEMKLASLVCVSSPSYFINKGSRSNGGQRTKIDDHEEKGIVIGVVGCRFKKVGLMEWQDMIVDPTQNTEENGYGDINIEEYKEKGIFSNRADFIKVFSNFYSKNFFPLWTSVNKLMADESKSEDCEYQRISNGCYFAKDIYRLRARMSAEIILLEANDRALIKEKRAFVHIVGFGFGVCKEWAGQEKVFLDGFAEALNNLEIPHVSDVYFSWFGETSCGGVANGGTIGKSKVKVHFGYRSPHDKLEQPKEEDAIPKIAVVTYAWDGNSLPGNEFWDGMLCASGNPAQASSSQIGELHNPHINPKVCGSNVRIACPSSGKIVPIKEYLDEQLKDKGAVEILCLEGLGGL